MNKIDHVKNHLIYTIMKSRKWGYDRAKEYLDKLDANRPEQDFSKSVNFHNGKHTIARQICQSRKCSKHYNKGGN